MRRTDADTSDRDAMRLYQAWLSEDKSDPARLWELAQTVDRYVYAHARRLIRTCGVPEHAAPDLISEGRLAAFRAAQSFDPSRSSFLHYARFGIEHRMWRWVALNRKIVRPPINLRSSEKAWVRALAHDVPLQTRTGEESTETVGDSIPSDDSPIDEIAALGIDFERLTVCLSDRERHVIMERLKGFQLHEIGARMIGENTGKPISRQRVEQIERRAITKIEQRANALAAAEIRKGRRWGVVGQHTWRAARPDNRPVAGL